MTLNRVRVTWTNFPGAPGLTTHYLSSGTTDMTALKTFYSAIKDLMPNATQFTIPNNGDQINESDGKLSGVWTGTNGGPVTSIASASLNYAGSAGSMVKWNSGGIVSGHRVVGRTFLVPMVSSAFFTDGSLQTSTITQIQNAAQALLTAYTDAVKVWARPFTPKPGAAGTARVGSLHTVTSASVPDLAVVLRSRRI
jgi:hypothetical protein